MRWSSGGVNLKYVLPVVLVAIAAPLIAFWAYGEGETVLQPKEPPGTQVVVQWFDSSPPNSSVNADPLLDLLYTRSDGLYVVDSFDVGAGTMNVFLYADDPDKAVRHVIELFEEGVLRDGMRIGVADTQGTEQSTRTYHPVYPPSLAEFKLLYPGQNASQIH
jgi:hypothetical protein